MFYKNNFHIIFLYNDSSKTPYVNNIFYHLKNILQENKYIIYAIKIKK